MKDISSEVMYAAGGVIQINKSLSTEISAVIGVMLYEMRCVIKQSAAYL